MFMSEYNKWLNSDILTSKEKEELKSIADNEKEIENRLDLRDKNICVVDMNRIGHGVTLGTTAKINYFQERIYSKIKSVRSRETAVKYLNSQKYAIENIKEIIETENIECDFKRVSSYVFANTEKEVHFLKKEIKFLRENKIDVKEDKLPSKITNYGSYRVDDTYIFHPLKYLNGIYNILKEKNIPVYENSKIIKIEKGNEHYICYGEKYNIKAKRIVLACHYPYFIIPFLLPFKSYIEKSYIVASKVKDDKNFTCISSNSPTYSCRFYQDKDYLYQISLAESHNTSVKQNDSYHFKRVKEIFNLKDEDIVTMYTNTDIMTPDHMPYIGVLKENMYIGVGYNTWGMTNGVLAARIISDMILNKENEYKDVFNPNRINLSNLISLPTILGGQIKSYLGPKINRNKNWYRSNIKFYDGLGCYIDEEGKEHVVYNRCPHFGCSLIFNEEEKTWDCPCHSSRFDIDGKCIKGPSNKDITYKTKE